MVTWRSPEARPAAAILGALLGAIGDPRPASAQTPDPRAQEARRACLAGQVQRGIAILTDLYLQTNAPVLLYNQGRCYEQNARPDEAIARFREYLLKAPNLGSAEIEDVHRHIDLCKQMRAQPRTPPETPQGGVSAEAATAAGVAAATQGVRAGSKPPPPMRRRPLRTAGVAVGAVGVAAFLGGLGCGAYAQTLGEKNRAVFSPERERWGPRFERLQWAGYGIGAIGVLGSATLFWLDASQARTARAAARVPVVAPLWLAGAPGISIGARF